MGWGGVAVGWGGVAVGWGRGQGKLVHKIHLLAFVSRLPVRCACMACEHRVI